MVRPRVLIVDDQEFDRRDLAKRLASEGEQFHIEIAIDSVDALSKTESFRPHVVLLDLRMPDPRGFVSPVAGLDVLSEIKARYPLIQVIVLTILDERLLVVDALRRGAYDYFIKGKSSTSALLQRVYEALAVWDLPSDLDQQVYGVNVGRLRRRRSRKEEHLDLYEEKLDSLVRALILETDAVRKFKLDKDIDETAQAIECVEKEVKQLTAQIIQAGGNSFESDSHRADE